MELDLDHLLNMTGGDADLAEEVIDIFESQTETWGRMLSVDLPQRDWADAAHTLKGSALSIGAVELAEICRQAETLGRGEAEVSRVHAATMLSDVKDCMNTTLEACAKARHSLSRPGLRASKDLNS